MSIWLVIGWFIILSLVSFILGFMFGFKKARKLQKEQEYKSVLARGNQYGGGVIVARYMRIVPRDEEKRKRRNPHEAQNNL